MRYQPVPVQLWDDYRFAELDSDAQRLFLYILTSPLSNKFRTYILRPASIASLLDLTKKDVLAHLSTAVDSGLIEYDSDFSLVFVHQPYNVFFVTNPKEMKGSIEVINLLPPSPVLEYLRRLIFQLKDTERFSLMPLREAIVRKLSGKDFPKDFPKDFGKDSSISLSLSSLKEGGAGGDVDNWPERTPEVDAIIEAGKKLVGIKPPMTQEEIDARRERMLAQAEQAKGGTNGGE